MHNYRSVTYIVANDLIVVGKKVHQLWDSHWICTNDFLEFPLFCSSAEEPQVSRLARGCESTAQLIFLPNTTTHDPNSCHMTWKSYSCYWKQLMIWTRPQNTFTSAITAITLYTALVTCLASTCLNPVIQTATRVDWNCLIANGGESGVSIAP